MRRALLATAGTVAGLVSVLSYSPGDPPAATLAGAAGPGLGAPAPAATPVAGAAAAPGAAGGAAAGAATSAGRSPGRPADPAARARRTAAAGTRAQRTAAPPAPPTTPTTRPSPRASTPPSGTQPPAAARPAPRTRTRRTSSAPAPTTAAPRTSATPTPSPSPVGPRDVTGAPVSYRYGTLQVAIRVQGSTILDAWAVTYPQGPSLPYSQMAIPVLRSETLQAQSARIAGATGATLTSGAWESSLASALTEAGLTP